MWRRGSPRSSLLLLAEGSLALVSVALLLSFSRLFDGPAYLETLVPVVVFSHAVTIGTRRLGLGLVTSALISLVGFVLLATWLWFPATTVAAIVPTAASWDALVATTQQAWDSFHAVVTPVPPETGFLVAAGGALFVAIFLADWAAFRIWSPLEGIVPAVALYFFVVMLGAEDSQTQLRSGLALCAACLLFLLASRTARLGTSSRWLASDDGSGTVSHRTPRPLELLRAVPLGAVMIVVAVAAGAAAGPALPGADSSAVLDLRLEPNDGRTVPSPLVDLHQQVLSASPAVAFVVESSSPSYWRLSSLEEFNGQEWRTTGSYRDAGGDLGAAVPSGLEHQLVEQRFTIVGLASHWLPAAFQPVAVDTGSLSVGYERDSSTLLLESEAPTAPGDSYRVVSALPTLTTDLLATGEEQIPDAAEELLHLPDGFPEEVVDLADRIVEGAGAATAYERAMALQQFFRDEGVFAEDAYEFSYVIPTTPPGQSDDAMLDFLATGEGYCQQFAGTFAAMARAAGLPTRLAVGYTWGDQDPADPGRYVVRARHSHTWPEVWLGPDVGWVAFEPTPSRGAPGMEAYAALAAQQVAASDASQTESLPTAASEQLVDEPLPGLAAPDLSQATPLEDLMAQVDLGGEESPVIPRAVSVTALLLAGGLVLYALVAPLLAEVRRRQRWQAVAGDPGGTTRLAWAATQDALGAIGTQRLPWETSSEFAERAAATMPEQADPVRTLAAIADSAYFASGGPDPASAQVAVEVSRAVAADARRRTPWFKRVILALDPRRLV